MPPPATPVVLTQPYRAKDQKGGTLIAEEVTDSATHRRKMADVDAYRPPQCSTCLHPTLHMHDRRERKRRDDPEGVVEVFPRYRCAHPACRAVWMVLAGFMARHLHRAWSVVESALSRDGVVVESGSGSPMPPVAARTRQRWRARLLSSAAVVLQALAESASVGTEALLVLGQCSTRAGLVDALARSGAVSWSRRLAELAGWLARALGVERPLWGGVTVTQRFGSDLRLNPHFHTATPDGVFALNATGDSVEFVRVPAPSTEDISAIVGRVHRYAVRLLSRRGLFADDGEAPLAEPVVSPDDAALGQCYGGALTGRAAFGPTAGRPSGRLGRLLRSTPPQELGPRCARSHGFNLHANVTVRGGDPDGLERLCRYLTRPPFSHERLERLDDDHIGLQLKTAYSDGTTHIALTHFELIERLCALVPRPNTHRVKYHGVFASASPHRSLVVPVPPDVEAAEADEREAETSARQEPNSDSLVGKRRRIRRLLWAELLKRTFGVDPKQCPDCGGRMKMIATIMRADVVRLILDAQGLPTEAPFIRPCRGPPSGELFEVWWT